MKSLALICATALPMLAFGLAPATALAANAKHPYTNVNKSNDKGNDSGDAAVAKLNQQQLDQIKSGQQ